VNPYHQIRERVPVTHGQLVWSRPWSSEELAEAVKMRRAGFGSTAISKKLKRTRNSVIGALHRAGEPGRRANQYGTGGKWSFVDLPPRPLPMRFSEQRRVP